jgi:5-hydroxyisourate hydrolase
MPNRTPVAAQLTAISNHLRSTSNSTSTSNSDKTNPNTSSKMAQRTPITCHVLDTTIGLPAAGINVILTVYESQADYVSGKSIWRFQGVTNADGRVGHWPAGTEAKESLDMLLRIFEQKSSSTDLYSTLEFVTGPYWEQKGIKAFFPSVTIQFVTTGYQGVAEGQTKPHWHVPLLLGPYNYTTYRGS